MNVINDTKFENTDTIEVNIIWMHVHSVFYMTTKSKMNI